jgi:predicted amidohydrolase
MEKYKKLA